MIELFDPQRLLPRRDWSLPLAGLALALGGLGLGAYAWTLHGRLGAVQAERAVLDRTLALSQPVALPNAALLADLQREVERLEAESGAGPATAGGAFNLPASHWMARLADLGSADISLGTIEVDRAGAVRIEGLALSPQAVSAFLQAWDQQQQAAQALPGPPPVHARAIEVREDRSAATGTPQWRFRLTATPPGPNGARAPGVADNLRTPAVADNLRTPAVADNLRTPAVAGGAGT